MNTSAGALHDHTPRCSARRRRAHLPRRLSCKQAAAACLRIHEAREQERSALRAASRRVLHTCRSASYAGGEASVALASAHVPTLGDAGLKGAAGGAHLRYARLFQHQLAVSAEHAVQLAEKLGAVARGKSGHHQNVLLQCAAAGARACANLWCEGDVANDTMTDAESLLSAPMEADGRRDTCVSTLVDAASSPCAWKANAQKSSTVSMVCVLAREAQRARLNRSLNCSRRQSALCAEDERRHGKAHLLARTRRFARCAEEGALRDGRICTSFGTKAESARSDAAPPVRQLSFVRCSEAVVFEPQDQLPWRASKRCFSRERVGRSRSCWQSRKSCGRPFRSRLLGTNGKRKPCRHRRRGSNLRGGRLVRSRARRAVLRSLARGRHRRRRRLRRHCSWLCAFSTLLRSGGDASRHDRGRRCAPGSHAVCLACGRSRIHTRRELSDGNAELSLAVRKVAACAVFARARLRRRDSQPQRAALLEAKSTYLGPPRAEHRLVLWVQRRLARNLLDCSWRRSANLQRRQCRAQRQRRLGRSRGLQTPGQMTDERLRTTCNEAHLNADVYAWGRVVAHDDSAAKGARNARGRDEERSSPKARDAGNAGIVAARLQAHVGDHVGHAQAARLLPLVGHSGGRRRGRGAPSRRRRLRRGWWGHHHRRGGRRRQQRRSGRRPAAGRGPAAERHAVVAQHLLDGEADSPHALVYPLDSRAFDLHIQLGGDAEIRLRHTQQQVSPAQRSLARASASNASKVGCQASTPLLAHLIRVASQRDGVTARAFDETSLRLSASAHQRVKPASLRDDAVVRFAGHVNSCSAAHARRPCRPRGALCSLR